MSSPVKTVSEKNLEQMEEWICTYTGDPDGVFGFHAFCVWCLTPVENHKEMLVEIKSLLSEPHIPESERNAQFEFFVTKGVHMLGLCEDSRKLLCRHVRGMIQHRPSMPGDDM